MSVEVHFTNVNFGVEPLEGGGKQLNLVDPLTGVVYRIPFVEKAAESIAERFGLSNEDLKKLIESEAAQKELLEGIDEVPGNGKGKIIDPTKRMPEQ